MTITSLAGNYDKPTEGGVCRLVKEDTLSTDFIDKSNFSGLQYATDVQNAWDCGYVKGRQDENREAIGIIENLKYKPEIYRNASTACGYFYDAVNEMLDKAIEHLKESQERSDNDAG